MIRGGEEAQSRSRRAPTNDVCISAMTGHQIGEEDGMGGGHENLIQNLTSGQRGREGLGRKG